MNTDRGSKILIDGIEYEMVLTTRAAMEITKRYDGFEKLSNLLEKSDEKNIDKSLAEIIWLLSLLINQGILIDNLKNSEKKEQMTSDELELLTSVADLGDYKNAIMAAIIKGIKRNVESEPTLKKEQAG